MRWILAILLGLSAADAAAQVSAKVALLSDYRFRGVSLSDGQAAAQVDLGIDDPGGAYAGLFASNVRFDPQAPMRSQGLAYAGYARRLDNGASIDAGANFSAFPGATDYNYTEVHAGFALEGLGGRVYYSPDYFGQGVRTVYAEINGSRRLARNLGLIGHAGILVLGAGQFRSGHTHADARAGIEYSWQPWRLQLSRVVSDGASRAYPVRYGQNHGTWTAMVSASF